MYMEIPVTGLIGEDVVANGFETSLRWASRNPRIKHVVFRVRSRGGDCETAEEILDIVRKHDERFQYHALVEEALGAAVSLVVCCDTIHMTEGSIVGGGDMKSGRGMNAVLVARLGSMARAKKHSFTLVRAMVLPEARAHVWEDEGGNVRIAPFAPEGVPRDKIILRSSGASLLTLPRDYAAKAGFAKAGVEKAADLGAALGLPGWRSVGDYAKGVMTRMRVNVKKDAENRDKRKSLLERNTEQRRTIIKLIEEIKKEAMENDPARFVYEVEEDERREEVFTSASKLRWRQRTQDAIEAWQRVADGAGALVQLERQAIQLGGKRIESEVNLSNIYSRALREIDRLKDQRRRSGP